MMDPLLEKQQDQLTTNAQTPGVPAQGASTPDSKIIYPEQFHRPLEEPPIDRLQSSLAKLGVRIALVNEPSQSDITQRQNPLQEMWERQALGLVEKIEEQTEENEKMKAALVVTEISHAYFLQVWEEIGKKSEKELPEYVDHFLDVFGSLDWFLQILQSFPQVGKVLIGEEIENPEVDLGKEYNDYIDSIKQIQLDLQQFFDLQGKHEKTDLSASAIMEKLSGATREFVSTYPWEEKGMRFDEMKLEERFVEMDKHNRALREQIHKNFDEREIDKKWFEPTYQGELPQAA